ncbi:hypothetical protein Pint_17820 [Pistacia integerrima]|uniref:Uncharacterized protein n=1 Tax=Pistacia integerrima TaxID=434235 RepID=A0ACC0YX10_9ROSI|nr:hypothetical protein Pint_17820 [Pistacia integerrima]
MFQLKATSIIILMINLLQILPHGLSGAMSPQVGDDMWLHLTKKPRHDSTIKHSPRRRRHDILGFVSVGCWCNIRAINMAPKIREDVKSGVYVENLTEEYVCTMKDVTQLLIKVNGVDLAEIAAKSPGSNCSSWTSQEANARLKCVYFPVTEEGESSEMIIEKLNSKGREFLKTVKLSVVLLSVILVVFFQMLAGAGKLLTPLQLGKEYQDWLPADA